MAKSGERDPRRRIEHTPHERRAGRQRGTTDQAGSGGIRRYLAVSGGIRPIPPPCHLVIPPCHQAGSGGIRPSSLIRYCTTRPTSFAV